MIDLRTLVYLDRLQPETTAMLATGSRGFMPLEGQASLIVEVSPGISINVVTDVVLKRTTVAPGSQIVERDYGSLEVHSADQGMVQAAKDAILEYYAIEESARLQPRIVSEQIITGLDNQQSIIINRLRYGSLIVTGETLYVLECHPAGYAAFACNEAEKAATVKVIDLQYFGAFGRLQLGGDEENINQASAAIRHAFSTLRGRPNAG